MSTSRSLNPFNPTYTWLHPQIKQLIQEKLDNGEAAPARKLWQPESIRCVLFEPFPDLRRILWVTVGGAEYGVRLDKLSLARLMALDAFMDERDALWADRPSLSDLNQRKEFVETPAIYLDHPYATSWSGLLLRHSNGGYEHLGDCWLFKLKRGNGWGSTHWMPAACLYPLSIPTLEVYELAPESSRHSQAQDSL